MPTVVHVGYFDLAQPESLRRLFPYELRQVSLEYLRALGVADFHFIAYVSDVLRQPFGGPPQTYVFYKNTAIYSVSRTFGPLDFGSFFGGHHMYNINKIHNMQRRDSQKTIIHLLLPYSAKN